jgi:hypothetical protein
VGDGCRDIWANFECSITCPKKAIADWVKIRSLKAEENNFALKNAVDYFCVVNFNSASFVALGFTPKMAKIKNDCQIIFNTYRYEILSPLVIVPFKLSSFLKNLSTHRLHLGRRGSKNVNKHISKKPEWCEEVEELADEVAARPHDGERDQELAEVELLRQDLLWSIS